MYIPKNRIVPNQYTGGDKYVVKSTQEWYKGFYYKTYDGKFYTGKTPNDKPNEEIELVQDTSKQYNPNIPQNRLAYTDAPTVFDNIDTPGYSEEMVITYAQLQGINLNVPTRLSVPYSSYPKPTEDDYELGVFTRYFCVKVNELSFLEINKETYEKLLNRDGSWLWQMFTPFKLQWTLTGDEVYVANTNSNSIRITERKIKRKGLAIFLKKNYLKFYRP